MEKPIVVFYEMDPKSPTKENTFFINDVFHSPRPKNDSPPPIHRHPFYEMILVREGAGSMKIDFIDRPVCKGALYLLSPSQIHHPIVTRDFYAYLLRFDPSIFNDKEFFDNLSIFNFDFLQLTDPDYEALTLMMANLYEEFQNNRPLKQCTINNLLKLLLIKIQRLLPEVINKPMQTTLFSSLNALMEQNGFKLIPPNEYAKELKISMKTLHATVKEYTGLACGEYIRSKTIIEAKRLLSYTALSAKEIAYKLGFNDTAYFSRFFKRETTLSPLDFRRNSL